MVDSVSTNSKVTPPRSKFANFAAAQGQSALAALGVWKKPQCAGLVLPLKDWNHSWGRLRARGRIDTYLSQLV
jgi:hypothetical protein